jgi:hypothetical protein
MEFHSARCAKIGIAISRGVSAGKPRNKKGIRGFPGCLLCLIEDSVIVEFTLAEEEQSLTNYFPFAGAVSFSSTTTSFKLVVPMFFAACVTAENQTGSPAFKSATIVLPFDVVTRSVPPATT